MPNTGHTLGVGDIYKADANVHAGAKYMAQLMDVCFKDVPFDEQNRNLFGFAAYDMGPGATQLLRRKAKAQKLDPNVWFNNVERGRQRGWARNRFNMFGIFTSIMSPIS
jgi:membrane-bound lytic murein transglycosylase MltF